MKAAVLREFGHPLEIADLPIPSPGPGEILIRVEGCGVCHSDLHLADGDWDLLRPHTKLPLILGHEIIGAVTALGDGVQDFAIGDRAGVPWLHWSCGECELCKSGREPLCLNQKTTGMTVDGGYAEFVKAPATHVARIPAALDSLEAAPLLCAGLTVYKAIKSAGIRPGDRLAVFGIGGLGHLAVQIARHMGVHVCGIDISDDKLALAKECGAEWVFNASANVPKAIRALGGAHVVMVTTASKTAYETALRCLSRGGTLAIVGMAPEPVSVSMVDLIAREARLIASAVGTREDLRELLDLAAASNIRCRVQTRPLEDITAILDEMKKGAILGRVVLDLRAR